MTEKLIRNENEAIECLKKNKPTSGYYMLQESVDMAIQALEENQQYHAIGTVEELQALKEKAEPKKPILIKRSFTQFYVCPHCSTNEHYEKLFAKVRHCERCGGAVDWS